MTQAAPSSNPHQDAKAYGAEREAGSAPAGSNATPAEHASFADGVLSSGDKLAAFLSNLTEATTIASGAWMRTATQQAQQPSSADPLHLWPSLMNTAAGYLADPKALISAQQTLYSSTLDLWRTGLDVMSGAPAAALDKRFLGAAWEALPGDLSRRAYAVAAECAQVLASQAPLEDSLHKRRLEFFTAAALNALAPSNYLVSNPAALEAAIRTNGESLLRGARRFAADVERGEGRLAISQTDLDHYVVGENIATTPGKVVFRNELLELLQYAPTTELTYDIPIVIVTPWINRYYIVDLKPSNSMVRWLTDQGFTVFVTSWVNPDPSHAEKTFADYMRDGVLTAFAKTMQQTGQSKVNAVGYCIGGTMLACAMAYLKARNIPSPIQSATFFAAQQDFSEAGDLMLFSRDGWLDDIERQMDQAGGVLPGHVMADAFNHLRPNELVWSFFVNNYLLGKDPRPFDLLFWNSDSTRMPKALHLWYLREFYQDNSFSRGELILDGVKLDLAQVETPVYIQACKEDHIAPFASVYRGAQLFGGPVTFTLAGSGHIAGVINPPAAGKYQHWINPDLPSQSEAWLAQAEAHPGSWWTHWSGWLSERSGARVPSRDPAGGVLPVLGDAPGEYVLVRA